MRVGDPDVQFTIIPIGSANDYAYSLGLDQKSPPPDRRVEGAPRCRSACSTSCRPPSFGRVSMVRPGLSIAEQSRPALVGP